MNRSNSRRNSDQGNGHGSNEKDERDAGFLETAPPMLSKCKSLLEQGAVPNLSLGDKVSSTAGLSFVGRSGDAEFNLESK